MDDLTVNGFALFIFLVSFVLFLFIVAMPTENNDDESKK